MAWIGVHGFAPIWNLGFISGFGGPNLVKVSLTKVEQTLLKVADLMGTASMYHVNSSIAVNRYLKPLVVQVSGLKMSMDNCPTGVWLEMHHGLIGYSWTGGVGRYPNPGPLNTHRARRSDPADVAQLLWALRGPEFDGRDQ